MDTATLLEHRDFVLHVARALLRDEADAEDAVQDTYVAAMQSAPPRTGRVRPWLGGIVRNIARNRQRSELRRVSREARAARPDRTSGAVESSERLAWQQRVVEAVLALEPKYRDVLVLRFYEDLPPREVASRLDIPVNTVRTRTRRAIERLRGVFDAKYGGRNAWSAAIAGLLLVPVAASAGVSKLLVAGLLLAVTGATGALLHSTTRGDTASTSRVALNGDATSDKARAATDAGDLADGEKQGARKPLPTHFRGRFFEHGSRLPLAGAEVILGRAPVGWFAGKSIQKLASAATDEEGRFALRWNPSWKLTHAQPLSYLLYVRRNTRWSDPIYAAVHGLEDPEGIRAHIELIDNPRFEFVLGERREPLVGARVSLFLPPIRGGIELGAPLGSKMTDAKGMVQAEWPSWADKAMIRVERPDGDVLQWLFTLQQARSYDPYDIVLDENELATVRMQVIEKNGSPAGSGVRVFAQGSWAPDGVIDTPYNGRRAPGAEPVPLIGKTNEDGIATFRFPADRARQGLYLPTRMIAFRIRDGRPDYVVWEFDRNATVEDQVARTGSALPTLRFGEPSTERPILVVHDVDPNRELSLYGRVGDGHVRSITVDTESAIRVSGFTLYGFHEDGPGPQRDGEEVTAAIYDEDRYRFTKLSATEFARCLQGKAVIEPGALRKTREFTIRIPSGFDAHEVWLESLELPFVIGEAFNSDGSATIELPDIPGKWRVLIDRERIVEGGVIDPTGKSDITLDLK